MPGSSSRPAGPVLEPRSAIVLEKYYGGAPAWDREPSEAALLIDDVRSIGVGLPPPFLSK